MNGQTALDFAARDVCAHRAEAERTAQACGQFESAPGAAWPWCAKDECGARADLHPNSGPLGAAVARMRAKISDGCPVCAREGVGL